MKPLALSGRAHGSSMVEDVGPQVFRLNLSRQRRVLPMTEHDAAIVRCADDAASAVALGYSIAVIIGHDLQNTAAFSKLIRLGNEFDHLGAGDIIGVRSKTLSVRVLFRQESRHNWFLVTERCNHYCLMCSQPPKDIDDSWILDEIAVAIPLVSPSTISLGFTGGEPFLYGERFMDLVGRVRDQLPTTAVHVLTNGRAFAKPSTSSYWAGLKHPDLSVGIPVYSAVDSIHDYIVQARGAFDETVLGIMRLKDRGQRVEVRLVLHALTTPRLEKTCEWIARNLPFVDHVALMGLENTGFAIANHELLWIDPIDYKESLRVATETLASIGVNVSIYNLPHCVLSEPIRKYAIRSISDWKNAFPPVCEGCAVKDRCAGFFSSGRTKLSRGIAPVQALSD